MNRRFRSARTADFTESVIRDMTRQAILFGAVNLAQGFPDFAAPDFVKAAACQAVLSDANQYSITWGSKPLRDAITAKYRRTYSLDLDPEAEITVCCGSTEGMSASLLATCDPEDEVIVFEPYYENYHPDLKLCGAVRKLVRLHAPDWSIDFEELRRAFSVRTKAIIVNSPHNPTGKVFSREELKAVSELCQEFDALAITDEIYEHIVYDDAKHYPLITFPGMRDRTILINSMSKTFSVTGWRVGWAIAAPELTAGIRKVHDFLTVGAPAPLQQASAMALETDESYYMNLGAEYRARRDLLIKYLSESGLVCTKPSGAYYLLAHIPEWMEVNEIDFSRYLVKELGVAGVPASSFYARSPKIPQIRFCFCKTYATLEEAGRRLRSLLNLQNPAGR